MSGTEPRVLLIHRYFWPDSPPYAEILYGIAGALASVAELSVLTAMPGHHGSSSIGRPPSRERRDGMAIRRIPLFSEESRAGPVRALNALLFSAAVFLRLVFGPRVDVCMVATTPPLAVGFAVRVAALIRRFRYVYHCQDIYPEIAEVGGLIPWAPVSRVLHAMDAATVSGAAAVVVLSEDMKGTLRNRGLAVSHVRVINNFPVADPMGSALTPPAPAADGDRVTVLFAGNMGPFQELPTLVGAAKELGRQESVEFVLMGDGRERAAMEALAGDLNGESIHFLGYRPRQEATRAMMDADLGVVSLTPGLDRLAFPSKLGSYLACGLPLVVIADPESQLRRIVSEHSVGIGVDPGDAHGLSQQLLRAAAQPELVQEWRHRAEQLGREMFHRDRILAEWVSLFTGLLD